MSLQVIYLTRHGFRSNWAVNNKTGEYTTTIPSPTGIPSDPALAGYGVKQSEELAVHFKTLDPPPERFYSSPFYRCIQTILPSVEALAVTTSDPEAQKIRAENGIGEWYGMARFDHPSPAEVVLLKKLFPPLNEEYKPVIKPSTNGERVDELHDRVAYALHRIIEQCDKEGVKAVAICTHGAPLIAIGRVLVGRMPEDIEEQDFKPFTCGLSTFFRKGKENMETSVKEWDGPGSQIPKIDWKDGRGVGGGWNMTISGDCSFLSGGEERGWRFSGDEAFDLSTRNGPSIDANELGVVVEGRKTPSSMPGSPILSRKSSTTPNASPSDTKTPRSLLGPHKL